MDEITIRIYESSEEEGYFYDIYDTSEDLENTDPVDGGFCTTTIENALEMAHSQALDIIKRSKQNV